MTCGVIFNSALVYSAVYTPWQGISGAVTKMAVLNKYYLPVNETREIPRTSFLSRPMKEGCLAALKEAWRKACNYNHPFLLNVQGGKKTWKSLRDKNNNYCQYKLQHGNTLRISAGCFHSGTCVCVGGGDPSFTTSTRVRDNISCLLLRYSVTCFLPFYSDTQSTCRHFKLAWAWWFITVILASRLHCDQSYRWIIARPFDRDASLCRHWCKRRKIQENGVCWWIVRPNQVKKMYPGWSICLSVFPWLFKQICCLHGSLCNKKD